MTLPPRFQQICFALLQDWAHLDGSAFGPFDNRCADRVNPTAIKTQFDEGIAQ
jgi:hypothetical protein